MAKATLTSNTMVLRMQQGLDDNGNPKYVKQSYSRIKLQATNTSILEVGEALNAFLDSDNVEVFKDETFVLGHE